MSPVAEDHSTARFVDRAVLKIVVTYAAFAAVWILLSDQLVVLIFSDPGAIALISTLKGWLFVAVTSLLLAAAIRRYLNKLKRANEQLRDSEERWKFALEGAGDGVWDWNIQTGAAQFSRRWKEMLGYTESEIEDHASEWSGRVHPEDLPHVMAMIQQHIDGKTPSAAIEFRMLCKDGRWLWVLGRGMVTGRDADGKALRLVGTNTDITERKQVELDLAESESRFREIFNTVSEAIFIHDAETGQIIDVNSRMCELYACTRQEALACGPADLSSDIPPYSAAEALQKIALARIHGPQIFEWLARARDGRLFWTEVSLRFAFVGPHERILAVVRDITDRKQMEDQVRQLAFYDALTNLPNRRLLKDRLEQIMALTKRSGCYGAVIFLDLDNLKPLNDAYGHEAGDLLLSQVAERLRGCIREVDTVGRFGGDEFVVILSELNSNRDSSAIQARIVAEKVRAALSEPYRLAIKRNGEADTLIECACSASIGAALFLGHEVSQGELLSRADAAMYLAKESGRNSIRFYEADR